MSLLWSGLMEQRKIHYKAEEGRSVVNWLQLWIPVQDLPKTESNNIPACGGEGLLKPSLHTHTKGIMAVNDCYVGRSHFFFSSEATCKLSMLQAQTPNELNSDY